MAISFFCWIQDGKKFRSGVNVPDPQHWFSGNTKTPQPREKKRTNLVVDLGHTGIILDAAVRVDTLFVHVADPVIRRHNPA